MKREVWGRGEAEWGGGETCFSPAFRSYELAFGAGAWDGSAGC